MTKTKWVRYSLDPNNLPPLTPEQVAELDALSKKKDQDIDTSDIPPLDEKFWQNAVRNPFFRPVKKQLTLRLDADLIEWFKRHADAGVGKERGYQTRINKALRAYVTEQQKKAG